MLIYNKSFVKKIKHNPPLIGTLITLESPEVAEIMSLAGFDWLLFDMEHASFSLAATQRMLQVTKGDCLALVRIPENSTVWNKRV